MTHKTCFTHPVWCLLWFQTEVYFKHSHDISVSKQHLLNSSKLCILLSFWRLRKTSFQMVPTLVYHDIRIGKDPKGGAKNIFLFLQKACLRLWHVQVIKWYVQLYISWKIVCPFVLRALFFLTKIVHKIWICPGRFVPVLQTFSDTRTFVTTSEKFDNFMSTWDL